MQCLGLKNFHWVSLLADKIINTFLTYHRVVDYGITESGEVLSSTLCCSSIRSFLWPWTKLVIDAGLKHITSIQTWDVWLWNRRGKSHYFQQKLLKTKIIMCDLKMLSYMSSTADVNSPFLDIETTTSYVTNSLPLNCDTALLACGMKCSLFSEYNMLFW